MAFFRLLVLPSHFRKRPTEDWYGLSEVIHTLSDASKWSKRLHTGQRVPDIGAHLDRGALSNCDCSMTHGVPGGLVGIVLRHIDGTRGQPQSIGVTRDDGMSGDRWASGKRSSTNQVSMMNVHVAHTIANGQSVVLFGDNLFVDLDLSEAALPIGTQFSIGTVRFEVSQEPHTPCHKFKARFGDPAFRLSANNLRLRGVLLTVLSDGALAVGDPIEIHRGSA
jgi:hypothetical protein